MSQQPSGVRGGTPPDRSVFQRRAGLKKATPSNVVADITGRGVLVGADAAAEQQPQQPQQQEASGFAQLHAAPAIQPEPLHLAPEPPQEAPAAQPAPVQQPAPAPVEQAPIQQPVGPPAQTAPAPVQVQPAVQPAVTAEQAPQPAKKAKTADAKVGFYQPREEGDRMRAAFIATRHITKHRTLSDFICSVVEAEVRRLEEEYNGGEPFESEPNGVPRGRPIG